MANSLLDQYRRELAAQGVKDDRDDFFVMRDTLGVWAKEDPALLTAYPDFEAEWRAIREVDSPGTLGGIKNTGRKAFLQSRQGMQAIGGLDKTDTEDVSQLETRIREIPSSVPWEDWQRFEGAEARKVFWRDPLEIVANIITAGFAGSVPALAGGLAGGLGGAAAGSPLGPAGSALAGTVGAVTGTFGGSLAVEYGGKYLDVLREEGADLADPESIQRVLGDPETRARARGLAWRRGVPVAAFDAASAGLAGKFFKGMKGATTGQIVRRGAGEALVQGGLGGGGEVAGALSAGEKIRPGSVFEEIIGEMGPAAVEIGGAAARRSIAGGAGAPPPLDPNLIPPVPPVAPLAAAPVAPLIPSPAAPVIPTTRTNAQVAVAVNRLTDEEAVLRLAELQAMPSRTADLDLEIELLLARVPEAKQAAPPTDVALPPTMPITGTGPNVAALIVTPPAASGTPVVVPTSDIVAPPAPGPAEPAPTSEPEVTYGDFTLRDGKWSHVSGRKVSPETLRTLAGYVASPPANNPPVTPPAPEAAAVAPSSTGLAEFGVGAGAAIRENMRQTFRDAVIATGRLADVEHGSLLDQIYERAVAAGHPRGLETLEKALVVIDQSGADAGRALPIAQQIFNQPAAVIPSRTSTALSLDEDYTQPTEQIPGVPPPLAFNEQYTQQGEQIPTVPPPMALDERYGGAPEPMAAPEAEQPAAPMPAPPVAESATTAPVAPPGVVVPEPIAPLPYGQLLPVSVTENFRVMDPIKPLKLEIGVLNMVQAKKGSLLPKLQLGDESGAKGVTKVGMALLMPDGVRVVLVGIVRPDSILRVAGGNEVKRMPALQRMGADVKKKRTIEAGGKMPVLVREVAEAGYTALGIYRFTGDPTVIFQQFPSVAAFDAAVAATPRHDPTARIRGKTRIEVEIDRMSPLWMKANEAGDVDAAEAFKEQYTALHKRQRAAQEINQKIKNGEPLDLNNPKVVQAVEDNKDATTEPRDVRDVFESRGERLPDSRAPVDSPRNFTYETIDESSLGPEEAPAQREAMERISAHIQASDGLQQNPKVIERRISSLPGETPGGVRNVGRTNISAKTFAEGIEKTFGLRVRFFETQEATRLHGFITKEDPNTIWINTANPNPLAYIIGHELAHGVEIQAADLHALMSDLVVNALPAPAWYAVQRTALGYDSEDISREWVSDMVGERFREKEFWTTLGKVAARKGRTSQFQDLLKAALDWLNELGRRMSQFFRPADAYLLRANIDQARMAIAETMVEFARGQQPRAVQFQTRSPQTETPAFKAWFGQSHAVEANGKPLRVYHGTTADIPAFDKSKLGTKTGAPSARIGFFFTSDPLLASDYTGAGQGDTAYSEDAEQAAQRLESAYGNRLKLSEQLLVSMNAPTSAFEDLRTMRKGTTYMAGGSYNNFERANLGSNVVPAYLSLQNPLVHDFKGESYRESSFKNLLKQAIAEGRDGAIFRNAKDAIFDTYDVPSDIFVVFEPTQIKSAIGNTGAFDATNPDIHFQSAPTYQNPRTDPSRIAVEASHTQQFLKVMNRLRALGYNVEVLIKEFFSLGVRGEIESQIAQLQQRAAGAIGPQKRAIERDIAHRQDRLAEVAEARGATFGPRHIALAVDDILNASMGNLITLIHEAVESLSLSMDSVTKGKIGLAIQASIEELRATRDAASQRTGVEPASEQGGPFDLLSETLAQKLAADGILDPSFAKAVWRWIKDLYYRAAMALQSAFGVEPSHELALDWVENQVERLIGGDYDYRIGNLVARFLPEQTGERISRLEGASGTPGAIVDFFDPYEQTLRQPGVLPNTEEGIQWNVQFQTGSAQMVGGLAIPNPEARARENAAGIRKFIEELDAIRTTNSVTTPWEEWWGQFATSGSDPRVMLAELEQRDQSLTTAVIGGERMNDVMNGEAALRHRMLMENFEVSAILREAAATENITTEADDVIEASREVNRLEKDRRNSDLQEGALQKRLKGLVRQFVKDNSTGYRAAEHQGALAEAVREAESLLDGDPIPERFQQVFKSVLDGKTPVFDYIKAIAGLGLDLRSMTQSDVVKAIRASADRDPALARLAENRPLLTALAVLARKNSGIVYEIELAYIATAEEYHITHAELQEIREATDEQLKQMLATMDARVKAVGPRDRIKRDYLDRRRTLREARDRLARAQLRVDTITQVLPAVATAVERAQQQGSGAPSDWVPVEGAIFTEMVPTATGWTSQTRELRTRNDGSFEDSAEIQVSIGRNLRWLDEKIARKGGKNWEDVNRQTMQMRALDASAQYATAQGRKMDRFLAPMMSEARNFGGLGPQAAQQLAFFEHIRFAHKQEVETNAHEWSRAWKDVQRATKIKDHGLLQKQIYDPISYFLNTEPGLDEEAAIRQALRMARARLTVPPSDAFNAAVERLLRASKAGFETLVRIATENGAFVHDTKLKSELRNAIARGFLTSMRSMDAGLVTRLTRDAEKYGWKLAREWVDDPRGGGRPKKLKKVKAVTFRDFEAEDMADSDAMVGVLNRLFPSGFLRDWLMPFINKGGVEVFRRGKTVIPQSVIQDAWAQAGVGTTNNGERILRWIDLVDAATASEEFAGETESIGDEDGDVIDEGGELGDDNTGRFRLNMLRQIDALFGMESKMAFDASQTRDMFDPFGPKPHVVMDARMDDLIPQEHVNFAKLDVQTSGMLLAEIAFHSAFGRNGARMVALLTEMRKKADAAKVDYEALEQTTDAGRNAEAMALGWSDPKELKRLAALADDIHRFQDKLEGFMGVGQAGGPFDSTSRVWMALLNFLTGQIVDNPKTAFYNLLNLGQSAFAQRSLGPEAIRTVSDAFVTTAKTGIGSLLEAMHLDLMHASAEELELGQTMGQTRNLPWSVAMADIGPDGRQGWKENWLIKPTQAIRFAQNKGVGLPFQGAAKDFPRLAVIPGLGVSHFVSQVAGRSGAMAITRQLERLLSSGARYFATHRTDATDPSFRFKAKDLGYGRWDQGILDWWRVKSVENNMGTIEDLVRSAMPAMAKGERIITKDQLLKTAGAIATEVNGDSSVNTMPGILISHPFLRNFFPLLRWPFWAMHKTNEGLATQAGKRNFKSYARGVGILAMWNLPLGLAFTFLLDEYDEEVTGKKSNLPPLGGLAAIPFLGPAAELLTADRSVPDTLVAYVVRGARAGNLGGVMADAVGTFASPTSSDAGRRVISLDQRVLVMSQLLNLKNAVSNVIHQDWTTTWASFWSPLFRSVGGNSALHVLDIVNNVVGLDNAESRLVMRTNASIWLRAAAGELDIELRPAGSGTPTPMSVHTREMSIAAMANDRVGFMESYRKALEAARKNVASDPAVPAMDREREAERRVLGGWRGRNPLGIFARPPTEIEVRRLLGIMDETGAQAVRDALNRYTQFTRLIAVSPEQQQARAAERRLMRPPTMPNPFRRPLAPTY